MLAADPVGKAPASATSPELGTKDLFSGTSADANARRDAPQSQDSLTTQGAPGHPG